MVTDTHTHTHGTTGVTLMHAPRVNQTANGYAILQQKQTAKYYFSLLRMSVNTCDIPHYGKQNHAAAYNFTHEYFMKLLISIASSVDV